MSAPIDDHADKYDDPRVKLSRRGILMGVGVLLFGIGGAALSIWARRTHLERSTEFWGPEVIEALQLAEEVELVSELGSTPSAAEPVRLSGLPGLGHLRHVLLDDRSYLWDSVRQKPISSRIGQSDCMAIDLSDPSANRFPDARIVIDLVDGWVGRQGGEQEVRLNDRFRNALPNYLKRIADYEPLRVEMQAKEESGG